MRIYKTLLLLTISIIIIIVSQVTEAKATDVWIRNNRNEKIKVCVYRSTDKTWVNPKKCWTIEKKKRVRWWRRGATYSFDVRVFRPALVDKRLCQIRGIGDIRRLYINSRTPCITFIKKTRTTPTHSVPVRTWNSGDRVIFRNPAKTFYWYTGKIIRKSSGLRYQVEFSDKSVSTVHAKYISGDHIRKGTKVQGNWLKKGRYYPGRVTSRNGDQVNITYDDGDKETTTLRYIRLIYGNLPKSTKYMLRVCNTQNERVYFSIAFSLSQSNYVSEGWWYLNKNNCMNVDLSKRWKKKGIPDNSYSRTFIYGETKGSFGGIVKKTWEGTDSKYSFCVNQNKTKYFSNKRFRIVNGRYIRNSCNSSTKEMIKMNEVKFPTSGTLMRWNF